MTYNEWGDGAKSGLSVFSDHHRGSRALSYRSLPMGSLLRVPISQPINTAGPNLTVYQCCESHSHSPSIATVLHCMLYDKNYFD